MSEFGIRLTAEIIGILFFLVGVACITCALYRPWPKPGRHSQHRWPQSDLEATTRPIRAPHNGGHFDDEGGAQ